MKKTEILAPAGSFEALTAAVRCGANAVYLGGKMFNARRNASNFSDEELAEAVKYCHSHNVNVYVTVNTLVSDAEMKDAGREILYLCSIGVDGLIVQDIGLADVIRKICPDINIHASTQMSVQGIFGIEYLKRHGFTRVVLPRELSENEIRYVSSHSDIELEYFVHGALCMCLSGQCLMSSMLGGRSGNRGLCAQPCRLPFGINEPGGNNLSLKDSDLIDKIDRISDAGIYSLKIEGRMKRPEYVAACVTSCKNSINGTENVSVRQSLEAVFSRSGFTSGYFDSALGKNMFGIRTKEDVENSAGVLGSLARLYEKENPLIDVEFHISIHSDSPVSIEASALGKTVTVTSDVLPSPAVSKPITEEEIASRISKCGGTQFTALSVTSSIDPDLYLPASVLNSLRRDALSALETAISERKRLNTGSIELSGAKHSAGTKKLHVRVSDISQLPDQANGISRIIIPISSPLSEIPKLKNTFDEIAVEIPVNVFSNGEIYRKKLTELIDAGADMAWACNLDGMEIAKSADIPCAAGFGMNIFNTQSIRVLREEGIMDCLVSSELTLSGISMLGDSLPRGVLAYGRLPLMVTRNCPVKNRISCGECGGKSELVDRKGIRFPVRCSNGCSFIFNSRPIYILDKQGDIRNVDYELLYFTVEPASECAGIIDSYASSSEPETEFTRGLYYSKVK